MSENIKVPGTETGTIVSFQAVQKVRKERDVYNRWLDFYKDQPHEELLDALVYEHENDFPMRSSEEPMDKLRHRAMVEVLQERARTQFLRSFLEEIDRNPDMRTEKQ